MGRLIEEISNKFFLNFGKSLKCLIAKLFLAQLCSSREIPYICKAVCRVSFGIVRHVSFSFSWFGCVCWCGVEGRRKPYTPNRHVGLVQLGEEIEGRLRSWFSTPSISSPS